MAACCSCMRLDHRLPITAPAAVPMAAPRTVLLPPVALPIRAPATAPAPAPAAVPFWVWVMSAQPDRARATARPVPMAAERRETKEGVVVMGNSSLSGGVMRWCWAMFAAKWQAASRSKLICVSDKTDTGFGQRVGKLQAGEFGIESIALHELGVGAAVDDFAPIEHEDAVGIDDGAQAMGNDQRGAVTHGFFQGRLNGPFALGVECAGRFVQ